MNLNQFIDQYKDQPIFKAATIVLILVFFSEDCHFGIPLWALASSLNKLLTQ